MLHTGLATFHFAHHYGAQLQAYATMKAIQDFGASCEVIDYRLPHTTRTNGLFKKSSSVRDMVSDAHTALHYGDFKRRYDRFEAFVEEHMTLSPQRYTTIEELRENTPAYDVYVAGSDQIWNPYIYEDKEFDPAMMLSFVKEGRRISYAPSLGVPHLPEEYAEKLRKYTEPFSALSAREKRGRDLIHTITGREPRLVLDPTLLLTGEEWGTLAAPPEDKDPYILCYFISDSGEIAPYAQELSARTGYPIVQLAGTRRKIKGSSKIIFDAGTKEFLGLFQNAAYVCTNSFHGAVFSMQFQKNFFTCMSPKERNEPTHSRIYSLLSRLGCTDRIVGLEGAASIDTPVDYEMVNKKLNAARADSLAYLKAAVEGKAIPPEDVVEEPKNEKFPTLCKPLDCTGCTACAAICPHDAIKMEPNGEGFLRPIIGHTCIGCRKCEKVCPVLVPKGGEIAPKPVYAVRHQHEKIVAKSTSGGFFTALATHVIEEGGIVFGAVLDEELKVVHHSAETVDDLSPLRQTKYVQSDLGDTFRQVARALGQKRKVLFSGTPCQVSGLKGYLGGDRENLLTCDLVCHGVPSPAVYEHWIRAEEGRYNNTKITNLLFREKNKGWDHARCSLTFADGTKTVEPLVETTFGRGFGAAMFLRPSCHSCPNAGKERPADFTLGDFWGIDPEVIDGGIALGVSLVMVNTEKGENLWPSLTHCLDVVPRTFEEAVAGNPRLLAPVAPNPKRNAFFATYIARGYAVAEEAFLAIPPAHYRLAAKVLTPKMKGAIRKILK